MKNNLRVVSLVMLISLIFSGSLLYYMIADIIVPSWTQEGVDLYVYVIVCVILISIVLKFITGMFGLTAFTKSTTEEEKQKKLKIGGKLSVPIAACGLLCLLIKLFIPILSLWLMFLILDLIFFSDLCS